VRLGLLYRFPLLFTCSCAGCGPTRAQRVEALPPPLEREHAEAGKDSVPSGFAHWARAITLTAEAPRHEARGIQLLRVEEDGAAVIHVDETGETLSARPGGFYLGRVGGPYHVRTFGEHGLRLASSDPVTQTAVLVQTWATKGPVPPQP
jgi:hypothetical protein